MTDREFTTQPETSEKCTDCGDRLTSDRERMRGRCSDCAS